jgi:hypothetical protein
MVVVYGLLVSEFSAPIWALFPSSIVNPYLRMVVETIVSTLVILVVEFFFKAFFPFQERFCIAHLRPTPEILL